MAESMPLLMPSAGSVDKSKAAPPLAGPGSAPAKKGETGVFQTVMADALDEQGNAEAVMPGLAAPLLRMPEPGVMLPVSGNALPSSLTTGIESPAATSAVASTLAPIIAPSGQTMNRRPLDMAIAAASNPLSGEDPAELGEEIMQRPVESREMNRRGAFETLFAGRNESAVPPSAAGESRSSVQTLLTAMQATSIEGASRDQSGSTPQALAAWSLNPSATTAPRAPTLAMSLPMPLQDPAWGQELSQRVTWMVRQEAQAAEIRINPPHLGPIEVRVSMAQDQVNVAFTAQHTVAREALDAAIPRLRDMLQDQGLTLAQADVGQQSFADQQPGTGQQGDDEYALGGHAGALGGTDISAEDEGVAALTTALSDRLVDFYA